MNFHLQFPIVPFKEKINYRQSFLFIGSCFAENIGEEMEKYKFTTFINPNGIVYNAASITIALRKHITNYQMKESELFFANEVWNSWEHHSSFSKVEKKNTVEDINNSISKANNVIKQADWLSITFGSAYYYKRNNTGRIVANCHKQPQKEFTKHLLTTNEIVTDYTALMEELKSINPKLKIVFTVSPVRYIRDGVIENTRSKAILIEAIHQLKDKHTNVFYFPAYELVIDDLRDYRFFKEDMVHPNKQAIKYVFEKFVETTFDDESKHIYERIKEIVLSDNHLPISSESVAHQNFIKANNTKREQLQKEFPFLQLR